MGFFISNINTLAYKDARKSANQLIQTSKTIKGKAFFLLV